MKPEPLQSFSFCFEASTEKLYIPLPCTYLACISICESTMRYLLWISVEYISLYIRHRVPGCRAAKIIVGPHGQRKLGPLLQIMIIKLSPPRCVISKESVQQKWIDELWFRKQLSTCLFVCTLIPHDTPALSLGLLGGSIPLVDI